MTHYLSFAGDDGGHNKLLDGMQSKLTSKAFQNMKELIQKAGKYFVKVSKFNLGGTEANPMFDVASRDRETHVCSLASCGCQAPRNMGLPCEHQLAILIREQMWEIPRDLIHALWRIPTLAEQKERAELLEAQRKLFSKSGKKKRSCSEVVRAQNGFDKAEARDVVYAAVRKLADVVGADPSVLASVVSGIEELTLQAEIAIRLKRGETRRRKKARTPRLRRSIRDSRSRARDPHRSCESHSSSTRAPKRDANFSATPQRQRRPSSPTPRDSPGSEKHVPAARGRARG